MGLETFPIYAFFLSSAGTAKNMFLRPFLSDLMYLNVPLLLLEMMLGSKILEDKFIT